MTRTAWVIVTTALLATGCATVTPELPAISETTTGSRDTGRIVWHDLITDTPEASRAFYGELFGWEFEQPAGGIGVGDDDTYMLIRHNGVLIGGMVDANVLNRDSEISQWVTVMSVGDIDAAAAGVAANGGEVLTPPTDVGPRGTMAVAAGPDRAIIALLETRNGDPEEAEPVMNGWLWNELWTNDVAAASQFFSGVAALAVDDRNVEGADAVYRLLVAGDEPRAAVLPHPFEGELPVWVNYLRVEDPAEITSRVEALGGRVIVPAQPRPIGGMVAFIAGPSGAGIALQTWPIEQGDSE